MVEKSVEAALAGRWEKCAGREGGKGGGERGCTCGLSHVMP